MFKRYYIDERVGCIAVRDKTKDSPDEPGLHPETTGVIKYWGGKSKTKICSECRSEISDGWMIPEKSIQEAHQLCRELNKGEG